MKNYKTSIGGVMVAVGAMLAQISQPDWVAVVGTSLLAIGGLIAGTQAVDQKGDK